VVILETEEEVVLELVALTLALVHADQLASEELEEVIAAGVLDVVVLEELHASQESAEATPAMTATVATENLILIDF